MATCILPFTRIHDGMEYEFEVLNAFFVCLRAQGREVRGEEGPLVLAQLLSQL